MEERLLKILFVGDIGVGKTAFIHRYTSGEFKHSTSAGGVDFSVKVLPWSEKERVNLQLWHLSGLLNYMHNNRMFYKGALGCVIMFDVTDSSSFDDCHIWKREMDENAILPNGDSIPCILLANKCDLPEWAMSVDSIDEFSKDNGFVTWMETSVKENKNVEEAMRRLVQEILPPPTQNQDQLQLGSESNNTKGGRCY